jgi:hypothetical protein
VPALEAYLQTKIIAALEKTPSGEAPDVYAISFFVYDDDDDPRQPTVTVGYNTETQVAKVLANVHDEDEARWNYASWLQNDLAHLGSYADPDGKTVVEAWVDGLGEVEDVTEAFVEVLIAISQSLHVEGVVTRIFGRPIPVIIHELEYYPATAEQTKRANPDGLARDFTRPFGID